MRNFGPYIILALSLSVFLYVAAKVFVFQMATITGDSMYPTYESGRRVCVNKLLLGPRLDFSPRIGDKGVRYKRLKGIRNVRVGDIVFFNYPFDTDLVYAKRCVAAPGDSIEVKNGRYFVNGIDVIEIPIENSRQLMQMDDSLLMKMRVLPSGYFAGKNDVWTIKNMGPLYVPQKGDKLQFDDETARIYSDVIRLETGGDWAEYIGKEYTFKFDYYFLCGDNVIDSRDSRYIGFVAEPFIIGLANVDKAKPKLLLLSMPV